MQVYKASCFRSHLCKESDESDNNPKRFPRELPGSPGSGIFDAPQGFRVCRSFCLDALPPDLCRTGLYLALTAQLKCRLLEAFPDSSPKWLIPPYDSVFL